VQWGSCVLLDASARKKSLAAPPDRCLPRPSTSVVGLGVRARRFWEGFLAETAPPRDPLTSCFLGSISFSRCLLRGVLVLR
jgi:hypothetical protein